MACGCGSSSTSTTNYTPIIVQNCNYSKQFYQDLLLDVQSQLQNNTNFIIYQQTVQSQINVYDKNCYLFQDYIENNILPLIT